MTKQNKIISGIAGTVVLAAIVFSGSLIVTNDITLTANYTTVTISGSGTALDWLDVDGAGFTAQCIKVQGKYIRVHNFIVEGCKSHAIFITGQNVLIEDNIVRHSVTENGVGKCNNVSSWGSGIKAEKGSQFVVIRNNEVYQNCGEGIASTMSQNVTIENNKVWDNFSVNIYVDNSNDVTVKGNTTSYTGDVNYYRNNDVGKCIMLGAENYSSYGWSNRLSNISILDNSLTSCKGISYWNPTNTTAVNVSISGNVFTNVRAPLVSVGSVPGNVTATPATSTPRLTVTRTAVPTGTPVSTAGEECLFFPIHKQTVCVR